MDVLEGSRGFNVKLCSRKNSCEVLEEFREEVLKLHLLYVPK
jgi:hypothetical protein